MIKQLTGKYECKNDTLQEYLEGFQELLRQFRSATLQHIPRGQNEEANQLAQAASGYRENQNIFALEGGQTAPEGDQAVPSDNRAIEDWRDNIAVYLRDPSKKVSRKLRYKALKFTLLDNQLYYKSIDGVLLKCLNPDGARKLMYEVHEGVCGAHQSAHRMRWLIRRTGYFWPTMLEDCFEYYKGC